MKGWHIAAIAAAGYVGWRVYQAGKRSNDAQGLEGSIVGTLRSGAAQIVGEFRAPTPSAPTTPPASAGSPTEASDDPRLTRTAPTHSRFRITSSVPEARPVTLRDLIAQGIGI